MGAERHPRQAGIHSNQRRGFELSGRQPGKADGERHHHVLWLCVHQEPQGKQCDH